MARRLATGALGIALMTVGLAAVYGEPFLGWLSVSLGILSLLSIAGPAQPGRYASAIGPITLAGAALSLSLFGLALRASGTLVGWTFAIAVALFVSGLPAARRGRL